MEKEILLLHDELKRKNTAINLLLETIIKCTDEKQIFVQVLTSETCNLKKNITTTKSVETKQGKVTSGEQLNMILMEGNHLTNTPSHKSNDTRIISMNRNNNANHRSQN